MQSLVTNTEIQQIHRVYCQATGFNLALDIAREQDWLLWLKRGFTADDLRLMVSHLRREIQAGRRNEGCLKFRNLIVNVDFFEEDLAELRARQRPRPAMDPAKASVLRATGRHDVEPTKDARSAADILAGEEAFKIFKGLKD